MPTTSQLPIFYSFRRCPYAMRARMAVVASGLNAELRDVLLKDKPTEMLHASPKATVPVLVLENGDVLEESLDIMHWAFGQADPQHWYPDNPAQKARMNALIAENDGPFKSALDRYKYHVRFPEHSREHYREEGEVFLAKLEILLSQTEFLLGDTVTMVDIAIFPFVRQFANSDTKWFENAPYPKLQKWLHEQTSTPLFLHIMKKRPIWQQGTTGPTFPDLNPIGPN